jgi:hypothetical protein
MNTVSRSALILGNRLGQGGQGTVYAVTNLMINKTWGAVYKEYAPEVLPRLHPDALISMADLPASLPPADARWLAEKTAWPAGVVTAGTTGTNGAGETAGGQATGFLMRAVPDQFQFDVQTIGAAAPGAATRRLAGLEFLLNPDAYVGQIGLRISQRDRLLLLADIAAAMSRLHSMDIIVGDLSPKNLLFSASPGPVGPGPGPAADHPGCFFIDCDAMQLRGADVLPQAETPNWQVPAGEEPATRTSDAYKFALLAVRLIARDQDANDPDVLAGVSLALAALARAGLSTDPAARPAPAQWVSQLRAAAQDAPVTYTAPLPRPPGAVTHGGSGQARHRPPRRAAAAVAATAAALLVVLVVGLSALGHGSTPPGTAMGNNVSQTSTPPDPADSPLALPSFSPASSPPLALPSSSLTSSPPSSPAEPADPLAGAAPGDCYANSGTEDSPQWQPDSSCGTGDFKVVQVEDGTMDSSACDGEQGWDLGWPDPASDQVLCLAYQDSSPAYEASVNQCVFGQPGQDWNYASCDPGSFTVVGVYQDTTSPGHCGTDSDEHAVYTVPGFPSLDKVFCLEMIFPYVATVQIDGCLVESGSGNDISFAAASSCSDANVVVAGRIFTPYDRSFCGQYAWYTWHSYAYPDLGVTVCLGSP